MLIVWEVINMLLANMYPSRNVVNDSRDPTGRFIPLRPLHINVLAALCRICEPIAFMSIFPYAYRMIETFDLTHDETQISIYAGMLITAFAFAEFSTGMLFVGLIIIRRITCKIEGNVACSCGWCCPIEDKYIGIVGKSSILCMNNIDSADSGNSGI